MSWLSGHCAEGQFPELCPEQNPNSTHCFFSFSIQNDKDSFLLIPWGGLS